MDIRGVGPSYGATGPSNDPKQQAAADVSRMQDLLDKLNADMQKGDQTAMRNDVAQMQATMKDLNGLAHYFDDPVIQGAIGLAASTVDKIADNIGQPSQQDINLLQGSISYLAGYFH